MPNPVASSCRDLGTQGSRQLATRIKSGEYAAGERLPTYSELSNLYDVSVTTVQRAIIVLQTRGLVVGLQGRGLWVAEDI
ncbi:winged helix-turn-helix domain-containing protein [Micromonospora saelicesensis]|uniref:winged helix-turn-helix domain-containing protein n=1 Tax=Micromonospora saelicesensis TaxID=285676 RepID=UPI000DDACCA5|nr:winged helix-turn-helix domain-containing protein [Micromonospora saelicesensis]